MFKVVSWQGQSSTLSSLLIFDARKRFHEGYILPSSVASSRISLVTFASIHCSTLSDPVRCSLLQLGFPIPSYEVIQPILYGCNSCALPRMRQLSLSDVCHLSARVKVTVGSSRGCYQAVLRARWRTPSWKSFNRCT